MTVLMEILYNYAQEHLIQSYLSLDGPYALSQMCAEKQEGRLRAALDQKCTEHLDNYLGEQEIMQAALVRAAFQAGYHIAMELAH